MFKVRSIQLWNLLSQGVDISIRRERHPRTAVSLNLEVQHQTGQMRASGIQCILQVL